MGQGCCDLNGTQCAGVSRSRRTSHRAKRPLNPVEISMSAPDPKAVLADLWRRAALDEAALQHVELAGAEPVLPSSFAIGTAAQATIAAAALAAGEVWRL